MGNECPKTIVIDGQTYQRVGAEMTSDIRIVVAQRGWVFVGRYHEAGTAVKLTNASVVRYWGTTRGLGEIADGGPTAKTKLDPAGTVRLHALAIVATFDCAKDKWHGRV